MKAAPGLVGWRWLPVPELGGVPQSHDLSHELLDRLVPLLEGQPVHVFHVQQGLDSSVLVLQRPPFDLGGVS